MNISPTPNNQPPSPIIDDKPIEIKIVMPTQAYFLSGIRDFTLDMVKNMTGFSEKWSFRFQSVVDELCNNAIEHGSKVGESIHITFISEKGKSLSAIVEDTGTGPSPKKATEMSQLVKERKNINHLESSAIRGRGLPQIISNWTDVFEDSPKGGLRVKIIKMLHAEEDKNISAPEISLSDLEHSAPTVKIPTKD